MRRAALLLGIGMAGVALAVPPGAWPDDLPLPSLDLPSSPGPPVASVPEVAIEQVPETVVGEADPAAGPSARLDMWRARPGLPPQSCVGDGTTRSCTEIMSRWVAQPPRAAVPPPLSRGQRMLRREDGYLVVTGSRSILVMAEEDGGEMPIARRPLVTASRGTAFVGISAARTVLVQVERRPSAPAALPEPSWEEVAEVSVQSPMGDLQVHPVASDRNNPLPPLGLGTGSYRLRVHAAGRATGDGERYLLTAWPAPPAPPVTLR